MVGSCPTSSRGGALLRLLVGQSKSGRPRFQQSPTHSSRSPQPPTLGYPTGSGNRKNLAGQISLAQINQVLKVSDHVTCQSSTLKTCLIHLFASRPMNTSTLSPEAPPPMGFWDSIAICCHPTTQARTVAAALPACQVAPCCWGFLMAMGGQHA